jgi:hypothetical protein
MRPVSSILKCLVAVLFLSTGITHGFAAKKSTHKTDSVAVANALRGKLQIPVFASMNAAKCKFSIQYKEKNYAISSSLKMVKDSIIQLSITPFLGIEMYRAVLRPDSITIIDKNNHQYFISDYGFLQKKFGVEIGFSDIQALLADCPLNDLSELNVSAFNANESSGYDWTTIFKNLKAEYRFDKDYRMDKVTLAQESSNAQFSCTYASFLPFDNVFYPTQCTVAAAFDQKQVGFTLTFDKITFDQPLNINAFNLENYRRVPVEQIIPF